MTRHSSLKLLWEQLVASPEANKDSEYGEYLFAQQREETPTPKEVNTTSENELLRALVSWVDLDSSAKLKKLKDKIVAVMAKGEYKPMLDPGDIMVYRGLEVSRAKAKNILGDLTLKDGWNKLEQGGTLNPLAGSVFQSWTSDPAVATSFSGVDGYEEGSVSVVVYARTTGNMFFGRPGKLAAAVDWINSSNHAKEMEVISIGPVKYEGMICYTQPKAKGRKGDEEEGWGPSTKHLAADMLSALP